MFRTPYSRRVKVSRIAGVLLLLAGIALVFMPEQLATALGRPYETAGEKINMRATWGGLVTGLGLLLVWFPGVSPRGRFALSALMWLSAGIAFGRGVGFALDGSPDGLQWFWMLAELAIVGGSAWALRRSARFSKNGPSARA